MLSESFIVSTLASGALQDGGVYIHEFQPSAGLRSSFKRSRTAANGLAITSFHVFAAQAEKAVVHVYNRQRGSQEATVSFPERLRSIAVASEAVLVLGTEGGRLLLWEICTGRQVSTSPSHLQPVTSLVIDPTLNFILSGSPDANVHVWSLPRLLSFSKPSQTGRDQQPPNSPIRTFSHHRTAITALAVGHSASRSNIAISADKGNTVAVWDFHTGRILGIFLLPSTTLCIAVDPANRGFYAGYETGGVQLIDFYKTPSTQHPLYDARLQPTPSQVSANDQWLPASADTGAAECLTLSYDGMTLLSGHRNGSVLTWDVSRRKFASTTAEFGHPVTSLQMLLPAGFPKQAAQKSNIAVQNVVKPRYNRSMGNSTQADSAVPSSYTFNAQLTPSLPSIPLISPATNNFPSQPTPFSTALTHPFFPRILIEEGLTELAAFDQGQAPNDQTIRMSSIFSDQGSIELPDQVSQVQALEAEIMTLKKRLSTSETARHATVNEVTKLRSNLARFKDYIYELQSKQEEADRGKFLARAKKEERDLRRREAWFEAEKQGENGDALVREMRTQEESEITSEEDDAMSDED